MRDLRGLSCTLLICLSLLPWLAAASEPAGGAASGNRGPDWAQAAGIREHFGRREHCATIHVSTSEQLIAAINSANSSGHPTVIHVAAGTYTFDQTFDSSFGLSVL